MKIAYRYRRLRSMYSQRNILLLLSREETNERNEVLRQTNELTGGWLFTAREAVRVASQSGCVNVLVSNGQLIPTLAKLVLYGLAPFFEVDHVYSSAQKGKYWCLQQIVNRFGDQCNYHVIGDGLEEQRVSEKLNYSFTRIKSVADLQSLVTVFQKSFAQTDRQ